MARYPGMKLMNCHELTRQLEYGNALIYTDETELIVVAEPKRATKIFLRMAELAQERFGIDPVFIEIASDDLVSIQLMSQNEQPSPFMMLMGVGKELFLEVQRSVMN